jgi:hypothetical protein
MPRGDWSKRFSPKLIVPVIVGLFITLLGVSAIVRGVLEQVEYEGRSYERSSEYTADTYGPAYDSCVRLTRNRQTNCIADENEKRRENERKKQDLIAQQTTAIWTFLMGCAAIIGMMLSALGVYLVWTTFRETKRNTETAYDLLKLERQKEKAANEAKFVFPGHPPIKWHTNGTEGSFLVTNMGNSQAYNLTLCVTLQCLTDEVAVFIGFEDMILRAEGASPLHHDFATFFYKTPPVDVSQIRNTKCTGATSLSYDTDYDETVTIKWHWRGEFHLVFEQKDEVLTVLHVSKNGTEMSRKPKSNK